MSAAPDIRVILIQGSEIRVRQPSTRGAHHVVTLMALIELEIRSARAIEKGIKLFDGGLFIRAAEWQPLVAVQVSLSGKGTHAVLDVYPDVPLKLALG